MGVSQNLSLAVNTTNRTPQSRYPGGFAASGLI
jgi:hypothetical protein